MRTFIIAALAVVVFASAAQAQVHPRVLDGVDVFKLEDEAVERWKKALPRLQQNKRDVEAARSTLVDRLSVARVKWAAQNPLTTVEFKKKEMWQWCFNGSKLTSPAVEVTAEKIGQLEVRTKLCEETKIPK